MLDAWNSWDIPYTMLMAERLSEHDITRLAEPVLADKLDSYLRIQLILPSRLVEVNTSTLAGDFDLLLNIELWTSFSPISIGQEV